MAANRRVAIVGAGPGGLAAARYLLLHGFEPVLFEQSAGVGGQWNQGATHSGIWPAMVTNTSRVTTQFSDLPLASDAPMFLHNREVLAYLEEYCKTFGIDSHLRLRERVERIEENGRGQWEVTSIGEGSGRARTETFPYAIISSGRYNAPTTPSIPGLDLFPGSVEHTYFYRGPEKYRGKRVLVAGCAISAVEISPEIAMGGAARVFSCMRRQRYVLQRIVEGVPIDLLAFTRYGVLASECLPRETMSRKLKEFILRTSGIPEVWGGRAADPDPYAAGITQGQMYLPLIAEGRILPKPWIHSLKGGRVQFEDGSEEEVDAILFATGFRPNLPFLSERIRQVTKADGPALALYRHTFHPQLPRLAFLGIFHQSGPTFVPLELQARWIAYQWSGRCKPPSAREMEEEMLREPPSAAPLPMNKSCVTLAREAGVEPDPEQWPELKRALLFGPLAPVSFRLSGPDALPDAPLRFAEEAARYGVITSSRFTAEQEEQLRELEMTLQLTYSAPREA